MGKTYEEITPELRAWIEAQHLFFVATAPLSGEGLVNCSPKGMDTFRILGPREVGYLDLTGSGIETVAHLRENGRICVMFCAFTGPPQIVRLQGTGAAVTPDMPEFEQLREDFPKIPGERSIIRIRLHRISDSCGYGVPKFDFVEQRNTLVRLSESEGPEKLAEYRKEKNSESLDGLPGLPRG